MLEQLPRIMFHIRESVNTCKVKNAKKANKPEARLISFLGAAQENNVPLRLERLRSETPLSDPISPSLVVDRIR